MALAFYLRYILNLGVVFGDLHPSFAEYAVHFLAGFGMFLVLATNLRLYDWNVTASLDRSATCLVKVALFWAIMYLGASLVLRLQPPISRLFVGYSSALMCVLLPLWRFGYMEAAYRFGFDKQFLRRIVIVGCTAECQALASRLAANRRDPYTVVGIVGHENGSCMGRCGVSLLGSTSDLGWILEQYDIDAVAVADTALSHSETLRVAKVCERHFVEFNLVPSHFEVFTSCLGLKSIGGQPVLGVTSLPANQVLNRLVKRMVDIAGALVGLLLTATLTPAIVFLVWRESPGPIIYRQCRTGEGGKTFMIYKFRSMKLNSEADGKARWCAKDDPRRLKIGAFMRKWNIDELPQFWNVLKGDMSLVGPRPERPELIRGFLEEIPYYQSRHSVKPGMTGWAQVHGLRGDTSLEERIRYDLQYIENWSIWLDFLIKYKTIFAYKNAY